MIAIGRRVRVEGRAMLGVSWKVQLLWFLLLLVAQFSDVWTTAFGISHGTIEGNVLVAAALHRGGITLFWFLKLLVAAALLIAVILVRRFARFYPGKRALFMQRVALRGTQLGALALILVSINNLAVTGLLPLWPNS